LHFDFSTGASGDKVLGALLEACEALGLAGLDDLRAVAEALAPGVGVARQHVVNGGIAASHLTVSDPNAPPRHWLDIRRSIEAAAQQGVLDDTARDLALLAFGAIAEAEAAVHHQPLERVRFHEVGAADSIVDVVGSCHLLSLLAPQAVYASPLVLGYGTFTSSHGEMAVPAPATARLVIGLPTLAGPHPGEMTTPTGAALAAAFVTDWQPLPLLRPLAFGYGAGSRQVMGASNTVRLLVGETAMPGVAATPGGAATLLESATLIEANIDHRSPESLAFAAEELLAAGALDVWQEPITMKKGRLAVKLAMLCSPDQCQMLADRLLALTGSLGLRMRTVERVVLPRQGLTLDTPWGPVSFKSGRYVGQLPEVARGNAWLRPEHDEVARLARSYGLDYQGLYDDLLALGADYLVTG
jgi:uncharacterized protein (TIGR00299 family) protein